MHSGMWACPDHLFIWTWRDVILELAQNLNGQSGHVETARVRTGFHAEERRKGCWDTGIDVMLQEGWRKLKQGKLTLSNPYTQ